MWFNNHNAPQAWNSVEKIRESVSCDLKAGPTEYINRPPLRFIFDGYTIINSYRENAIDAFSNSMIVFFYDLD